MEREPEYNQDTNWRAGGKKGLEWERCPEWFPWVWGALYAALALGAGALSTAPHTVPGWAEALPAFSFCQRPPASGARSHCRRWGGRGPELGETGCCQEWAHTKAPREEPGQGKGSSFLRQGGGNSGFHSHRRRKPRRGPGGKSRDPCLALAVAPCSVGLDCTVPRPPQVYRTAIGLPQRLLGQTRA